MGRDVLIGIDAGTSVMKAVAFSLSGEQLAMASRPNHYVLGPGGTATQSLAATWADCAATLNGLADRVENLRERVEEQPHLHAARRRVRVRLVPPATRGGWTGVRGDGAGDADIVAKATSRDLGISGIVQGADVRLRVLWRRRRRRRRRRQLGRAARLGWRPHARALIVALRPPPARPSVSTDARR